MQNLLKNPMLWYALAALVAGGLILWLYSDPFPSILSILFDIMILGASFFIGLAIISQFVLPVQTTYERRRVLDHFISYAFGMYGPIIFVREGKVVSKEGELQSHEQGVALIDASSALVLQREYAPLGWYSEPVQRGAIHREGLRQQVLPHGGASGPPLVRAAGPGLCFIEPGEKIVAAMDLRRQGRGQKVKALTGDGIEIEAFVSVAFGLSPQPHPLTDETERREVQGTAERNKPAYEFNPDSAFRAVYGTALNPDRAAEKQKVDWTELPLTVAVEQFRNLLAECKLDSLFEPKTNAYPFADFQKRLAHAVREAPVLRDRGIIVYSVAAVRPIMPREVLHQRVQTWQNRWQMAARLKTATGEVEAVKTMMRWRTLAQSRITHDLREMIAMAHTEQEKKALALMLTTTLQRAASESNTRQWLTKETLKTLESMHDWID